LKTIKKKIYRIAVDNNGDWREEEEDKGGKKPSLNRAKET